MVQSGALFLHSPGRYLLVRHVLVTLLRNVTGYNFNLRSIVRISCDSFGVQDLPLDPIVDEKPEQLKFVKKRSELRVGAHCRFTKPFHSLHLMPSLYSLCTAALGI